MSVNDTKWMKVKELMVRDLSPAKAKTMNCILENVRKESDRFRQVSLMENASPGATSTGNIAILNKTILPVIRRVLPGIVANNLVGIQPMTGPVSQIHSIRVLYAQSTAGVLANSEAMAPAHVNSLAVAYSGNENASSPAAANTIDLEGVPGNAIRIEVLKEQVRAKTRRLSARWTIEAAQDTQAMQALDLEAEIMAAIAQEITVEIDQEILRRLRGLPPTPDATNTFDQSSVSGQAVSVVDEFAALAVLINREANQIGTRTRRGVGNWVVVSPTALTILQSARASAFARTTEGDLDGPTNTKLVGKLNNQMDVYCDTYASDTTPVLVGFKGTSELDAGCYYCPYVPLTSTPTIWDPNTLEPVVGFYSRYGWLQFDNKATSLGNSADYYGLVGISPNFTFY